MWYLKTTNEPIIMGDLGIIKKGTNKHINKMLGNPGRYEIINIALCGTAPLLRRVLAM